MNCVVEDILCVARLSVLHFDGEDGKFKVFLLRLATLRDLLLENGGNGGLQVRLLRLKALQLLVLHPLDTFLAEHVNFFLQVSR